MADGGRRISQLGQQRGDYACIGGPCGPDVDCHAGNAASPSASAEEWLNRQWCNELADEWCRIGSYDGTPVGPAHVSAATHRYRR
jgi:hypothetical protein